MTTAELDPDPIEVGVPNPFNDGRDTLSPSALSAFDICGRRGEFYKDPDQPRTASLSSARGSAWHAALEKANRWRMSGNVPAVSLAHAETRIEMFKTFDAICDSDEYVPHPDDAIGETVLQLDRMLDTYWKASGNVRWEEPEIRVVAVEERVWADFGSPSHVMVGVIDVVFDVDGSTIGVDYKSAGRAWGGRKAAGDPRLLNQGPLYSEAWQHTYGAEMDWFVYDVMTVGGKFQRVWCPTHAGARRPMIDRWLEVSETIALHNREGIHMPTNPSHMLCSEKWCSYWDVCPMGSEYDRVLPVTHGGTA